MLAYMHRLSDDGRPFPAGVNYCKAFRRLPRVDLIASSASLSSSSSSDTNHLPAVRACTWVVNSIAQLHSPSVVQRPRATSLGRAEAMTSHACSSVKPTLEVVVTDTLTYVHKRPVSAYEQTFRWLSGCPPENYDAWSDGSVIT